MVCASRYKGYPVLYLYKNKLFLAVGVYGISTDGEIQKLYTL